MWIISVSILIPKLFHELDMVLNRRKGSGPNIGQCQKAVVGMNVED